MIKKLLLFSFMLIPFMSMAQNTPPVLMQMRDGKIYFDNVYSLDASIKKEDLYNNAQAWFNNAFPYPEKAITVSDLRKGEIDGTGVYKIELGNGIYYWIRFTLNISIHNATYEVKLFDVYEKPFEKGISNEYSKIEYRWWDYRQGKPWGPDDKPLFKGLSINIGQTMDSLEKDMNK